jgi:hypothetical protein
MALQRSTTRATPLERSFRFILIFAGDAQVHRQQYSLRIPREGVNPSSHWPDIEQTSAFGGWYCGAFRLLIAGVARRAFVGLNLASLRTATDTGYREKM